MKKSLKDKSRKIMAVGLGLLMVFGFMGGAGTTAFAGEADYGAAGASVDGSFTLEEMLSYALEDEYLARAEYEKIMEAYGTIRPFSNIMKAEETHIDLLLPLFEAYGVVLPEDASGEHVAIPESLGAAFETGVQAEIDNIAMYDKFLGEDLPEDVRAVFEALKRASESHLSAFERGTANSAGATAGFMGGAGRNGNINGQMKGASADGNSNGAGAYGSGYGFRAGSGNFEGRGLGGMVRAGRSR